MIGAAARKLVLLACFELVEAGIFKSAAPPPPPPPTFLETALQCADDCHITVDAFLVCIVACGAFANPMWRLICFCVAYAYAVPYAVALKGGVCPVAWYIWAPFFVACFWAPVLSWINSVHCKQPVKGAVFVTGADSGMGYWTASRLAAAGFDVFAGLYNPSASKEALEAKVKAEGGAAALSRLTCVPLDVTRDESVEAAAAAVQASGKSVVGVINCAGLGYTGPAEYFTLDMYRACWDINFLGYVRVVQAFMPLLRAAAEKPGARRGRIVCIGTGGGRYSPAPPMISAYMASKWSAEAYVHSLRFELQLRKLPIDACMLNPGTIKPTALADVGLTLAKKMWSNCVPQAEAEYGELLTKLIAHQANEPGTHVSAVSDTMLEIMTAGRPRSGNMVGPDSKATAYIGCLPTGVYEFIIKFAVFKRLG